MNTLDLELSVLTMNTMELKIERYDSHNHIHFYYKLGVSVLKVYPVDVTTKLKHIYVNL